MAKANKRQALGRGLSALLDDSEKSAASKEEIIGNVIELPLEKVEVNPFQPRTNFNEESIEDLAKSIQALGVIQPITVRKIENDNFQLVSGERRLRAAKSVGLQTIPSFIRIADDQESLEMALVENIQREDLDPIEIALFVKVCSWLKWIDFDFFKWKFNYISNDFFFACCRFF